MTTEDIRRMFAEAYRAGAQDGAVMLAQIRAAQAASFPADQSTPESKLAEFSELRERIE